MKKLIVTDLDGTLLNDDRIISGTSFKYFKYLLSTGIIPVIATGRSLFSIKSVLSTDFPVSYLISSSGAGIFTWPEMKLLYKNNLQKHEIVLAANVFKELNLDFTIQYDVPDNHRYIYFEQAGNPDFLNRNKLYRGYGTKAGKSIKVPDAACQLIGFAEEKQGEKLYNYVKSRLQELNVIRSSSPLDHKTVWIEVYPKQVSKKHGIDIIAGLHQIMKKNIMVVGNDYNDLNMLNGYSNSYVVDNAPDELKSNFSVVPSNNKDGVVHAVKIWIDSYV